MQASKLLFFLVSPLIWSVILLLCSFIGKTEVRRKKFQLLSVIILFLFSNTFLFDRFMNAWEAPVSNDDNIKGIDCAILLTGMSTFDVKNGRLEFNDRTDRLMQVLRLYNEKKISRIILSGGPVTGESDTVDVTRLYAYLITAGIRPDQLTMEMKSANTHENAVFIKPLLARCGSKKFLLVTSAWHMRRAVAAFRKEGIDVIPYSTDRLSGPPKSELGYLLIPSSATLFNWEKLLHEWMGCIWYRLRGYI